MPLVTFNRPLKEVYVSYFNPEGKKVDDGFEDFDTGDTVEVVSHDEEDGDKLFLRVVAPAKEDLPAGYYKALNEVPKDAIDGLN